jgi:hypothetical protein
MLFKKEAGIDRWSSFHLNLEECQKDSSQEYSADQIFSQNVNWARFNLILENHI